MATRLFIPAATWTFGLTNGRTASVVPDQNVPFRFEVLIDGESLFCGLTSQEAEQAIREAEFLTRDGRI